MLSLHDREQSRLAISRLVSLLETIEQSMERGTPVTPEVAFLLGQVTQSSDPISQHNAIDEWLDNTKQTYRDKLRENAQNSLSCFAEFMNMEEPPAPHHEWLCGKLELLARRVIMRMIVSMPPGHAKAVRLNTAIPTPYGWSTVEQLRVGDQVFDETGKPCTVIRKTDVFKDRPSYTVKTDCGDEIVADEDHNWLVRLCGKRDVYTVKTTKYLADRQLGDTERHRNARAKGAEPARSCKRPQISRAGALQLPEANLPIDPYVLGYWLGDGVTDAPITVGAQDRDWLVTELTRLGCLINAERSCPQTVSLLGMRGLFKSLGLIGHKHIPMTYLRSSVQQRKNVLQGIVDSGGHVMPTGQIEIASIKKDLAENYQELVRSLGVKCSMIEREAICHNAATASGIKNCGPYWTVTFYMKDAARLPRKASLTRDNGRTPGIYIDVTQTDNADTMCIEVDSPSHLFLVGKSMTPTHNSTYCTHLFPAWYLGNHPKHKYIQAGHTQDFVDEEFGKKVRGIIDSDDYRLVFPDIRLDPGSKAASRFALAKHKGKYLGRGVGQGISGFRANIAAVDDPFASREDVESPTVRKKVFDWYMADLTTRLLPRSPLFIVATRWHTDDLCGRMEVLNQKGLGIPYDIINLPAISEGEDDPLGRRPGTALWPDFYTIDHLLNLRSTLPARDWNSLYQGKPMDVAGGTFQAEWVKRYDDYPRNETNDAGRVIKLNIRRMVVSVDTAAKTGERNDYTVIGVWIEDTARRHYLVDVVRKRAEFNDMVDLIEDTVTLWNNRIRGTKVIAILIEDKGSGTQYIQTRRAIAPAPVIAVEVGQNSKEFRFDGICPMFEAGEVLLPNAAGWLPDYERELLSFPTGNHDDQVDMTSQYLAWARSRRAGGTKKLSGMGLQTQSLNHGGARLGGSRRGNFSPLAKIAPSARIGG